MKNGIGAKMITISYIVKNRKLAVGEEDLIFKIAQNFKNK
jgi:hypothetical protein